LAEPSPSASAASNANAARDQVSLLAKAAHAANALRAIAVHPAQSGGSIGKAK
jgi:hypothetical protein